MSKLVKYGRPAFPSLPSLFDDDFFGPTDVILDRLMSETFPQVATTFGTKVFENAAYPRVDIRETDTQFILEAETPGLSKDQVKVEVKDDVLVIRGEKRDDSQKEGKYNVREIKRSSFIRSFTLPTDIVDKNTVKAKFTDGILEVRIGKLKPSPPPVPEVKSIQIE